jgi:N-acyl-L-homoserine lactone synthetase
MSFAENAMRDVRRSAQHAPREWFDALISARPAPPGRARAEFGERTRVAAKGGAAPITLKQAVRASIATETESMHAAADLVRKRYAWRGYENVCAAPACACAQADCEHRVTLVAQDGDGIVGTLTVGLDSGDGLLVDHTYGPEVEALRAEGRRVCELTRFAVDAEADSKAVLTSLFGLAYMITRALHNATDVLVEVNPRHVAFYRRILGFCVASAERVCERVQAPAVLLRLEISELERRLMQMGCFEGRMAA